MRASIRPLFADLLGCDTAVLDGILDGMGATRPNISAALLPPSNAHRLDTPRGSIAFWQVRPNVYLSEVRGYLSRDMAHVIIERADPLYRNAATLFGFHNWFEMENYDSASRVDLTAWVLRHRSQSALHIGLTSRLVAMGVSVANLALGSLIAVHNEPRELEAALSQALQSIDRG